MARFPGKLYHDYYLNPSKSLVRNERVLLPLRRTTSGETNGDRVRFLTTLDNRISSGLRFFHHLLAGSPSTVTATDSRNKTVEDVRQHDSSDDEASNRLRPT